MSFRACALPIALLYFPTIEPRESVTRGTRAVSDAYIDARDADNCELLEPSLGARIRPQCSSAPSASNEEENDGLLLGREIIGWPSVTFALS